MRAAARCLTPRDPRLLRLRLQTTMSSGGQPRIIKVSNVLDSNNAAIHLEKGAKLLSSLGGQAIGCQAAAQDSENFARK